MTKLGRNMRRRRREKKWSQERLAREAGVHVGTVSGVEVGHHSVTLRSLSAIAEALDCSVIELLGE